MFQIVFALTISTMVYIFTDQPRDFERFLKFSFVVIVINIIADAVGLIVGTLFNPVVSLLSADLIILLNKHNLITLDSMEHSLQLW